MITARDARETVEKAIEQEVTRRKERAEQFCEELSEKIISVSKSKMRNIIIETPTDTRNYVIQILQDNGYTTKVLGDGRVDVMW